MGKKPKKMPPAKTVSKAGRRLEHLEDTQFDEAELAADFRKIDEIEQEVSDCRVNFRWDNEHLRAVKLAALAHKMPYQRYIKEVVFAHACATLGIRPEQSTSISYSTPSKPDENSSPTTKFNSHSTLVSEDITRYGLLKQVDINSSGQPTSSLLDSDKILDSIFEMIMKHRSK